MGGYCIDTSAILDGWVRYYPIDIFPGLWSGLDGMIATGELIAPDEVLVELEAKADDVFAWAKARPTLFLPLDQPIMTATQRVLERFPRLVGTLRNRNRADPFVIATALVGDHTVVTAEKGGTEVRPRIPFICEQFGVRSIDLLGLIREKGWTF